METKLVQSSTSEVNVYAVGGTAVNVLRQYLENAAIENRDLFAKEFYTYIDSSDKDIGGLDTSNVFRIAGVPEGAGKDREIVKQAFRPQVPELLLKHPPRELNVVIFNTAGGTGSGAAPLLVGNLLKEGHAVVCLMLSDETSSKPVANTINSMSEIEQVSQMVGKNVLIHHARNDRTKTRIDNNASTKAALAALSILASGKNSKLDTADIRNFTNFSSITHHKPGLAELVVTADAEVVAKMGHAAAMAAVLHSETVVPPVIDIDYDAIGYVANGNSDKDLYFVAKVGLFETVEHLQAMKKDLELKHRTSTEVPTLGANKGFDGASEFSL